MLLHSLLSYAVLVMLFQSNHASFIRASMVHLHMPFACSPRFLISRWRTFQRHSGNGLNIPKATSCSISTFLSAISVISANSLLLIQTCHLLIIRLKICLQTHEVYLLFSCLFSIVYRFRSI